MAARNWTDYALLEQYFEQRLINIVQNTGKHYVVWQEIFDNGLSIDKRTIVDVWKGENWQSELFNVTSAGFQSILSVRRACVVVVVCDLLMGLCCCTCLLFVFVSF